MAIKSVSQANGSPAVKNSGFDQAVQRQSVSSPKIDVELYQEQKKKTSSAKDVPSNGPVAGIVWGSDARSQEYIRKAAQELRKYTKDFNNLREKIVRRAYETLKETGGKLAEVSGDDRYDTRHFDDLSPELFANLVASAEDELDLDGNRWLRKWVEDLAATHEKMEECQWRIEGIVQPQGWGYEVPSNNSSNMQATTLSTATPGYRPDARTEEQTKPLVFIPPVVKNGQTPRHPLQEQGVSDVRTALPDTGEKIKTGVPGYAPANPGLVPVPNSYSNGNEPWWIWGEGTPWDWVGEGPNGESLEEWLRKVDGRLDPGELSDPEPVNEILPGSNPLGRRPGRLVDGNDEMRAAQPLGKSLLKDTGRVPGLRNVQSISAPNQLESLQPANATPPPNNIYATDKVTNSQDYQPEGESSEAERELRDILDHVGNAYGNEWGWQDVDPRLDRRIPWRPGDSPRGGPQQQPAGAGASDGPRPEVRKIPNNAPSGNFPGSDPIRAADAQHTAQPALQPGTSPLTVPVTQAGTPAPSNVFESRRGRARGGASHGIRTQTPGTGRERMTPEQRERRDQRRSERLREERDSRRNSPSPTVTPEPTRSVAQQPTTPTPISLVLPKQTVFSPQSSDLAAKPVQPSMGAGPSAADLVQRRAAETYRVERARTEANALFFNMFVAPVAIASGAGAGNALVNGLNNTGTKTKAAFDGLEEAFGMLCVLVGGSLLAGATTNAPKPAPGFSINKSGLADAYAWAVYDAYKNYKGPNNPLDKYEYPLPGETLQQAMARHRKMTKDKVREDKLEAIRQAAFKTMSAYAEKSEPVLNKNYKLVTEKLVKSIELDPANKNPESDTYRAELINNYTETLKEFRAALTGKAFENMPSTADYDVTKFIKFGE